MDDNLDPNPALRAELNKAYLKLRPEVDGLFALTKIFAPGPLQEAVRAEMRKAQTQLDAIRNVLVCLDRVIAARQALEATGYPDLEAASLPADLLANLKSAVDSVNLAEAAFGQDQQATKMVVTLGPPVDKKR